MPQYTHTLKELVDRCQKQFQVLMLAVGAYAFVVLNVHLPLLQHLQHVEAMGQNQQALGIVNETIVALETRAVLRGLNKDFRSALEECEKSHVCTSISALRDELYEVRTKLNEYTSILVAPGDWDQRAKEFLKEIRKPGSGYLASASLGSALLAGPPLLLVLLLWFGTTFERLSRRVIRDRKPAHTIDWFPFQPGPISRLTSWMAFLPVPILIVTQIISTRLIAQPALDALRIAGNVQFAAPTSQGLAVSIAVISTLVTVWLLRLRARALGTKSDSEPESDPAEKAAEAANES